MVYCEYCGSKLGDEDKFCSNCGAPAPIRVEEEEAASYESEQGSGEQTVAQGDGDCSVILVSLGNCTPVAAGDLLEDILGYSDEESAELVAVVPAQVAQALTLEQAQYIAQAMTEYGMEVSVRKGSEYVEADESALSSVFDAAGSFIGKVVGALGALTAANRMRKIRRWERPDYRDHLYAPHRRASAPPPMQKSRLSGRKPLQTGFAMQHDRPMGTGLHRPPHSPGGSHSQKPAGPGGSRQAPGSGHPGMLNPGGSGHPGHMPK